ncbi:MAG: DNA polymerase III subunit delta [Anaerovoracaceae bacterium]
MASGYYKEKEKEHAFITIEKDLKSGKIPEVVLLCGKEDYLIRWYTDALVDRYVSDACRALDLVVLEEEDLSFDRIQESLETVSLMSERKVVVLPGFLPAAGRKIRNFPEADVKALTEYLPDVPEGSLLIMTAAEDEDTNPKNKIRTVAAKCGRVYDFQPLNDKLLRSFIEKRFRSAGKVHRTSVTDTIINASGYGNKAIEYNLYNLENDLKKIIAHSCGGEITDADVMSVLSVSPENNVFAMLDAIGRNRKDEAFRLLHNLLVSGTPEFGLVKMITSQIELILSVKELKEEGNSLAAIQKKLGVHQFRVKKAMALTGRYSSAHLKKILSSAYDIDENIKSGLFDSTLALEFFIANI